jgi:hypothetical protein
MGKKEDLEKVREQAMSSPLSMRWLGCNQRLKVSQFDSGAIIGQRGFVNHCDCHCEVR